MKIIGYREANQVEILFLDTNGAIKLTAYREFKNGSVKNPYHITRYGLGFLGQGRYSSKEHRDIYSIWNSMLRRCYLEDLIKKRPTYADCTVCIEWHNFQNFSKWYEENYYEIEGETMCLDKDILFKGNKIYSQNTCTIVPTSINGLFVLRKRDRGSSLIGTSYVKSRNMYTARVSNSCGGKDSLFLGYFKDEHSAFNAYKQAKESQIKGMAEKYKGLITKKTYEAMLSYKITEED